MFENGLVEGIKGFVGIRESENIKVVLADILVDQRIGGHLSIILEQVKLCNMRQVSRAGNRPVNFR